MRRRPAGRSARAGNVAASLPVAQADIHSDIHSDIQTDIHSDTHGDALSPLAGRIVAFITATPNMTMKEMADALGVTQRTVEREIKKLHDAGKIVRVGGRRYGHWETRARRGAVRSRAAAKSASAKGKRRKKDK